jgi:WD40 repeat protein
MRQQSKSYFLRVFPIVIALASMGCLHYPPRLPATVIADGAHNNGSALAFDADVRVLASGGSEGRINLWRLPDLHGIRHWQAHDMRITGLQFLHHGSGLVSVGYDAFLVHWNSDGNVVVRVLTPSPIFAMTVDESNGWIITGHKDGAVRRWRLRDLTLIEERRLHKAAVRAVAVHGQSRQLASSGKDGRVFIWRLGDVPRALPPPPTDAHSLAFSPDGTRLTGSGWFRLFRWTPANLSLDALPTEHFGVITSIDYSDNGNLLASISRETDSAVNLLDPNTGAVRQRFEKHALCGNVVRLSPDGRYLASTSDDSSVRLWVLNKIENNP